MQTVGQGRPLAVSPGGLAGPELTVVVPTFNERENVGLLVERLDAALAGINWEVVFVDDDSPDGTSDAVRNLAQKDRRVRIIRRIGRRGLSSASVEGVLSSSAPYFVVMDADLQHDDAVLPVMLEKLRTDSGLDIVVGTRYADGGEAAEGFSERRAWLSRAGNAVARVVLRADLSDPMSGYFAMPRASFDQVVKSLSQQGFKILLDIFTSAGRPLRYAEVPYVFRARQHGESKLDTMAAWEFGMLVLDKLIGHIVPVRFVVFAAVGATGLAVHLLALGLTTYAGAQFVYAQTFAVIVAMTWNFFLNNFITYRDQRLRGARLVWGLLSFYLICSVGAVANVGVADFVFNRNATWWLAGLAGAAIGVVWNFAVSSFLTWRRKAAG
jgi:dolichol-phosphate mannosyltransferase